MWTNIKTLYVRNNIVKKRIPNMRLASVFLIFRRRVTMAADIFTQFR